MWCDVWHYIKYIHILSDVLYFQSNVARSQIEHRFRFNKKRRGDVVRCMALY